MSLERCHSKTANTFNYCAHDIETGKGKRRRKTKTPPKKKLVQTDRRTRSSDRRPLSSPNASENSCSDCSKTCKCASRSSTVRCNIAIRALKKHDELEKSSHNWSYLCTSFQSAQDVCRACYMTGWNKGTLTSCAAPRSTSS